MLSLTIPPEWSPRPKFHKLSKSLVTGEHRDVSFDSGPLTFGQPQEAFFCTGSRTKRIVTTQSFSNSLSSQPEKKTRFVENELKMQPKLSTG